MGGEKHKKRVLVLVAAYPTTAGEVALMYVHVRSLWYMKNGLQVDVLNLSASSDDCVDGIRVLCKDTYKGLPSDYYELLILHAPNIRQHYIFLKRYGKRFKHFLFFFHGHEVLRRNKVYSRPYPFIRRNRLTEIIQDFYDCYKLRVWRRFFQKEYNHIHFVFVSNWMKEQFLKWTQLDQEYIEGRSDIIYNSIHPIFEVEAWNSICEKEFDFITIRSNWDGSKYAVDIVNELAANNPDYSFMLVGKGVFFDHYKKANNLMLINRHLKPEEIPHYLNKSRYALMPTRTDAQGLMMCEMASFGMPLITSDIPVCREVLGEYDHAYFISNVSPVVTFNQFDFDENRAAIEYRKFFKENTVQREIELIDRLFG